MEVRVQKEERDWRLPGLLSAYYLVLYGELGEHLKVMVGCFVEVCKRMVLKANTEQGDGIRREGRIAT